MGDYGGIATTTGVSDIDDFFPDSDHLPHRQLAYNDSPP